MVELSKAPIDESDLAMCVVDHDIMGLDIAVNDALGVAEIQSFQDLEHVEPNIEIRELFIKCPEILIPGLHVLHDLSRLHPRLQERGFWWQGRARRPEVR